MENDLIINNNHSSFKMVFETTENEKKKSRPMADDKHNLPMSSMSIGYTL